MRVCACVCVCVRVRVCVSECVCVCVYACDEGPGEGVRERIERLVVFIRRAGPKDVLLAEQEHTRARHVRYYGLDGAEYMLPPLL